MGKLTSIEWCDHTFNIAWGCVKASPGCDNCYAEKLAHRYGYGWGSNAQRRLFSDKYWNEPLLWNKAAIKSGRRQRVFCSSMTDVFLNDRVIDMQRERLWSLIEATPALDWLILTKHPERFRSQLPENFGARFPTVWLMVSVENNETKWRVRLLLETSAFIRGLSVEPLLENIRELEFSGIAWVIIGGESGPGSRPMDISWAINVAERAASAGAAVFVKQIGAVASKALGDGHHRRDPKGGDISRWPEPLRRRSHPVNPNLTSPDFHSRGIVK